METILCAAIWYKDIHLAIPGLDNQNPVNVDKGAVFCGHRHPHCMYTMVAITGKASSEHVIGEYVQGFLTNKNRFVDRVEARKIAYDAGQLAGRDVHSRTQLFSEDLY